MPLHPISRLLKKKTRRVLGINTGTSIDALDVALIEIRGTAAQKTVRLIGTDTFGIPKALRQRLREMAAQDHIAKKMVVQTHVQLGELIADCINKMPTTKQIDLIGCHGQTIGHFPGGPTRRTANVKLTSATWQIGSPNVIAQRTGIVTVGDFRAGDIAAGGMGAPLSGYYHYLIFGREHAVLNLGGIANISAVCGRGKSLDVLAFDIGPGNMITDAVASEALNRDFDRGGKTAASGKADRDIVARALAHPYFRRKPPKTCGREEFGEIAMRAWFGDKPLRRAIAPTLLATAVAITAGAIERALHKWVEPFTSVRSLLLCGGGAKNKSLVNTLRETLTEWTIADTGEHGIPAQYVEPAGFAVLADETIHGRAGNLGGATEGSPAVLGTISLPPA